MNQFGSEPIEIRATDFIEDVKGDPLGVHTDRYQATLTVKPDPASAGKQAEAFDVIDDEIADPLPPVSP